MAIVEIFDDDGSVPVRIEVAEGSREDSVHFCSSVETREVVKSAAKTVKAACAATAQPLTAADCPEHHDDFEEAFAYRIGVGADTTRMSPS
jgi:hypothetical protein